jgi:UDP-2,3-diacylglucosamine hydrolase
VPAVAFISDLHLAPEDPAITRRFLAFVEAMVGRLQRLYILGDLFEIWIGDDELDAPFQAGIAGALRTLVDSGTPVAIMHGNRDFLLGPAFMAASGASLLPDPSRIDLFGVPTLLMHGDSLCIDDQPYQDFRRQVRDPAWQRAFLAQPIETRRAIARQYRADSRDAQTGKTMTILDVNPGAVAEAFLDSGCARMIHGHTHRPARHESTVENGVRERWVLPDWYGEGGYLICDPSGCRLNFHLHAQTL